MPKLGYVPEHFSTPIHWAVELGLDVTLVPVIEGTGRLIALLNSGEIDFAIGLTEGFVADVAKGNDTYNVVGTYVNSPLCWAVSTGKDRDVTLDKLNGGKIGVSRIGLGSYIMPFVLAMQHKFSTPYYADFPVLSNFKNLRDAVNGGDADAFMWEHFTLKKYYDSGEIKKIGEIYTPWPSWVVVSRKDADAKPLLSYLAQGIDRFWADTEASVRYIYTHLDYSEADAAAWLKTVEFNKNLGKAQISEKVFECARVLRTAGVLNDPEDIVRQRLAARICAVLVN